MAFCIGRSTVCLVEGVNYRKVPSQREISWLHKVQERPTVRASRCAAVRVVSKLMNVHAPLSIGIMAGNVP